MPAQMALNQRQLAAATCEEVAADATFDPATGLRGGYAEVGATDGLAMVDLDSVRLWRNSGMA